jgi:hypothetical protein
LCLRVQGLGALIGVILMEHGRDFGVPLRGWFLNRSLGQPATHFGASPLGHNSRGSKPTKINKTIENKKDRKTLTSARSSSGICCNSVASWIMPEGGCAKVGRRLTQRPIQKPTSQRNAKISPMLHQNDANKCP